MKITRFGWLIPALVLLLGLGLSSGGAQAQLTKQRMIVETGHFGTGNPRLKVDLKGANNETPQRANAPTGGSGTPGTGFTWGGYESGTNTNSANASNPDSALVFLDGNDAGFGIFLMYNLFPGQYYYTIFSSAGTNTPDQYIDLSTPNAKIGWNNWAGGTPPTVTLKVRWLIRSNFDSKWYVSNAVTVPAPTTTSTPWSVPVNTLTWYAVTPAVSDNLNLLKAGDEVPLGFNESAAATPNLSKIDGGGFYLDAGGADAVSTNSFKPSRLTFDSAVPYLVATPSSAYSTVPSQLVLGLGTTSGIVTLTNGNNAAGALIVKNVTLNSPNGRITVNPPPPLPATLTNNSVDIGLAFNQNGTQPTTASLTIVYNNGTVDETVVFPILGRGVIDGTIYESFFGAGNMAVARNSNPNETPQTTTAPPTGTGFCWGAYTNATINTGGRDMVGFNTGPDTKGSRLVFYGATTDDANAGGAYHGSYAYTIFDTLTNGAVFDRTLNLHKFQFYADLIPTGAQIRWLVRDDQNRWFLSKNTISMTSDMANKLVYSDVDDLTLGWLRVDTPAEDHMNALPTTKATPSPQVGIAEPGTLTAGTPNLAKVTGGGIYVERGNTTPDNTALSFWDLNFIARPSNGDTLKVSSSAVTESYKVPNRRLAMAGLAFDVTSGIDAALDGVDVTVTPNTTGLRSVMLYSDPNGDGKPADGVELTNCTLDASTAHLLFRDNQIFLAGTQRKMALVALFDETATSKTYTLSIAPAQWKQDPENGGTGDTIVSAPNPVTASIVLKPVSQPDMGKLFTSPVFAETWNNATAGALPTTPATGVITGADNLWNYTWGSTNFAQIAAKNGSPALGNETKDMATEPPYNGSFRIDASLNSLLNFDAATTQVVRLKFDLVITSTTKSTSPARLSGRVVAEQSNISIALRSFSGNEAYNLTVYPLLDPERYMFGINYQSYMIQYAPANMLTYSNNNGLGTYQYTLYLSPYNVYSTLARVQVKHVETGKTLDWMTVIDGIIPNMSNLRYAFGAYPNAYIDNVDVTTFVYVINPVRRWSMFE